MAVPGRLGVLKLFSKFVAGCLAVLALFVIALGATGAAAQDQVNRGASPAWVQVMPETTPRSAATDEAIRILLFDNQFRADADQQSHYVRTRSQVLTPQGLTFLGNVGLAWSPSSQSVTVHHVNIVRDGQTIDVLESQSFETLRREENLEQAMLDGILTASLQPAGLRIGDVLDVAYTIVSRDPVTAGHAESAIDLNLPAGVDRVRYRASWPRDLPVRLRAANDWVELNVRRDGDHAFVEVSRDDFQPVVVPAGIPGRFQHINLIELSDYRAWSDIAVTLKPLYDKARRLDEESPLKDQIERIRALSDDPAIQAAAALRLVQDEVRYVALLMGEGALTPATADETWSRRFGDCKAKTALLLALLDGLDIAAEPAAVSLLNGDGINERLPMITAFDHVLVRAVVGDQVHWLDGTWTGDRALLDVGVPPFFWALPLTGPQAGLEQLVVTPKSQADSDVTLAIDATGGLYAPAEVVGMSVMRGEVASVLGGQIGMISAAQKDQGLRGIWSAQIGDLTIDEVASVFDADASVLTLTMKGKVKLDWSEEGLIPPGTTYIAPTTQERPDGPFKSVPYVVIHPTFSRQTATLRLPAEGRGFRVSGGEVDRAENGHHVRRSVRLEQGDVTIETTMRSVASEISAEDAEAARAADAARPHDPPRVFAPANYAMTDADRAAVEADVPTTAAAWLDRAYALSRAGDSAGALEAADKAVELDPESSNAWANRGVYKFWVGDREGAAVDLEKAVDIDPSERIAMNGNALLAMVENRHDDAVIELSRALRQVPGDDWTLEMRTLSYMALEQYERALRDTDARIEGRPDDVALKLQRVAILNMADRTDEADAAMDAVAEAHASDRNVLLNQAALKLERGDAQAASDILDRVITDDVAASQSALILRGEASILLDRLDLAARDFETVRAARADDAMALNNLCWAAATRGVLLDQALKDCDAALTISPDAPSLLDSRGRVLLQQGKPQDALASYERALEKSPNQAASLYGRGLARIALGQTTEGEADKAAALALAPDIGVDFESYPPPTSLFLTPR